MWTKITKFEGRGGIVGREKRTTPAVTRNKSGGAALVLPEGSTSAKSADIFSDGNGKLGFVFSDSGEYAVSRTNKTSLCMNVRIPAKWEKHIPFGTTDASLGTEAGMTILDLSQFQQVAA